MTAFRRSSVLECRWISLPASSTVDSVSLKSKRVVTSRLAWSMAFLTSCMSTSETTSKVGMPKRYRDRLQGSVPEWPKGADCKSAGIAFDGSNPSRPTHTKAQVRRGRRASGLGFDSSEHSFRSHSSSHSSSHWKRAAQSCGGLAGGLPAYRRGHDESLQAELSLPCS